MPSQNETKDLIINKLTKEQYKTITDSNTNNEVYHIIDDAHYTEAEIEELLSTKQNTLTSSNAGNGISIENGVISNTQTSAEWGNIQGEITSQSDLQTALNKKANNNEVVHLANAETITGAKTFTGAVHLIGSGDSNAVGISTNTRFNVDGTNKTVLGFGSGIFYINHGDYRLRLRGKDARPHYNSDSNYLALLSDIPDTSKFITMQDVEAKNYLTTIPDEYITQTELDDKGYARLADIQGKADASTVNEQLELKADKSTTYTKSEVDDKIADAVTGGQIDLSGYAKDGEVVHLVNSETITGSKTFTQPLKIQNGARTGSLLIGGDVNAGTVTNGARKLARIAVPTQANKDLTSILLGFDSNGDDALNITNRGSDNIAFGGSKKITNATSPMSISFCVAKERNATDASKKTYALEMDATEARFNSRPNYNGVNLATTVDVTNALNGYAKLTDIPDTSNLATKTELTEGLTTKQPTGNYIVNNAEEESIAIGTNSSSLGYSAISIGENSFAHAYGIGIGYNAGASMIGAISIGENSKVIGAHGIAIGGGAYANSDNAIQIGTGTNETENSLQVDNYTLLDLSTGKIPDERLSNNIARTTDIPDISNLAIDNKVVHLANTETITGNKTFTGTITGNLSGTATRANQDSNGLQINTTYMRKTIGTQGIPHTPTAPTYLEMVGRQGCGNGNIAGGNLVALYKNTLYKCNERGSAITCNYDDKVANLGKSMCDGSFSGHYPAINPSTSFTSKPFTWEVTSSSQYEVSDVCRLHIYSHRLTDPINVTKFKIEAYIQDTLTNSKKWITAYEYSGSSINIAQTGYGLYITGHSSTSYYTIYGIRLTISESPDTVFRLSEIQLVASRGTETLADSLHCVSDAGGKIWGNIEVTGTVNGKCTKDGSGNIITDTYAKKTDLDTKQNILTAGNGIKIENNVISSLQTPKIKYWGDED